MPREIAGRPMDSYHRWMDVTLPPTMAGLPTLAVPAGFGGPRNLPLGLQIIGKPFDEKGVLNAGLAIEQRAGFAAKPEKWW